MVRAEIQTLRRASRELVRQWGFLQNAYTPAGMSHSHCHALIELEGGELTQLEMAAKLRLDKSTTSRVVHYLIQKRLAVSARDPNDTRKRLLRLTAAGKAKLQIIHQGANEQVERAVALLNPLDLAQVVRGMTAYSDALARSRARAQLSVRPLRQKDNTEMEAVLRAVMPKFGVSGPGSALEDAEVKNMYGAFAVPGAAYFVVSDGSLVMGGGGFSPLLGADSDVCELKKFYFLDEVRGLGFGQEILDRCLQAAKNVGYRRCYLETFKEHANGPGSVSEKWFSQTRGPLRADRPLHL